VLEVWLPLLAIAAVAAWWYHVLRLRERVIAHARQLCGQHGVQLLDDSVGLHRLRAKWRRGALHVTREYRFETSCGGNDRRAASITLDGDRIVDTSMPACAPPDPGATIDPLPFAPCNTAADAASSGNVVPFTRTRRTLH
jgi:hypothetical protein